MIGIGGGSASGKTSMSQRIIQNLGVPWASMQEREREREREDSVCMDVCERAFYEYSQVPIHASL